MIKKILDLYNKSETEALDLLYDTLDNLAFEGKFGEVDKFLSEVDVVKFPTAFLLGILTISLWMKNELKNRETFYKKVFDELLNREDIQIVEKQLLGLN